MIQKIRQIGVQVKNLDRAIRFYKESLGLPLLFQAENLAFMECNGIRLLLSPPEKEEFTHASSIIYYQVENIKESYNELSRKEVSFLDEPHLVAKIGATETWMSFFHDTEGNTLALMSEIEV